MANGKCIENVFHDINKFTNLHHDRERNRESAANFDIVRDRVLSKMREHDKLFKKLSRGHSLAGSVADNIKICLPDEYDCLLPMRLLYFEDAVVTADNEIPGNVKINIKTVLKKCEANQTSRFVYDGLKEMVDDNDFLLQVDFQGWIQGILTKVGVHRDEFNHEGRHFVLTYKTSGPAHTCHVKTTPNNFSIDLVPALLFSKKQWCALRACPPDFKGNWHAIPKPVRGSNGEQLSDNISWQGSYAKVERELIDNKNNLKNALRILKKLKERQNYGTFRSYFVKTMFLWELDNPNLSWNQPLSKLVFEMTKKWVEYLKAGKLPFYWDQRCNLLANAKYATMALQLEAVYNKMLKYQSNDIERIYRLFLTDDEINSLRVLPSVATQTTAEASDKDESMVWWFLRRCAEVLHLR